MNDFEQHSFVDFSNIDITIKYKRGTYGVTVIIHIYLPLLSSRIWQKVNF